MSSSLTELCGDRCQRHVDCRDHNFKLRRRTNLCFIPSCDACVLLHLDLLQPCPLPLSPVGTRFGKVVADVKDTRGPVDRFFDLSVGSDYPGTLIRDDGQAQLKLVTGELGFRYIRFRCSAQLLRPPWSDRAHTNILLDLRQVRARGWSYFTGISTGAPLSFTRNTMNLAGSVGLAFRPTTWTSSGPS
jgi:hypothetical protein